MRSRFGRLRWWFAACMLTVPTVMMAAPPPLPKIKVFATGGTISGSDPDRDMQSGYKSGSVPAKDLLAGMPEVNKVADLSTEDVSALGSGGNQH